MKSASLALINYLANLSENEPDVSLFVVDLYTIRLVDGVLLRWCSGDLPLTIHQGPITGFTLFDGGKNYKVGDTGVVAGSSRNGFYQVTSINPVNGTVLGLSILNPGTDYQVWDQVLTFPRGIQPGLGSGLMINITGVTGFVTFNVLSPANTGVPAIARSRINSTTGFSVDDLKVKIAATPLVDVDNQPLLAQFINGDFDGASVLVQRAFMPTYGDTSLGTITTFFGRVGDVTDIGSASATLSVKALTELLNIDMPRNQYQSGCRHTLFDFGCTLSKAAFTIPGIVIGAPTVISIPSNLSQLGPLAPPSGMPSLSQFTQAGVNQPATVFYVVVTYVSALGESTISPQNALGVDLKKSLRVASPPAAFSVLGYNVYVGTQPGNWQKQNPTLLPIGTVWSEPATGMIQGIPPPLTTASGYFTQGVITFTSGRNQGLSRYVLDYASTTPGTVTLIDALPFAPAPGDTFNIVPGCDKQQSTCTYKFNNLINFGGQPFVPVPETVL